MRKTIRKTRTMSLSTIALLAAGTNRLPGVIIDGVVYETPQHAADTWGVTTMAISSWINGQVVNGIYYPPRDKCRPVFANKKHQRAWERQTSQRVKMYREPPGYPPAVVIDGFIYPSTADAAAELGVCTGTIQKWCATDTIANCWYESNKVYFDQVA